MIPTTDARPSVPSGDKSHENDHDGRRVGQVVRDTYRITRYIASGGSSHVFEVEHLRLGKAFAMKLLRPDFAGRASAQRFRREAKAVARLNHEHVVLVVDCGELEDGTPYLVMELLEGRDLRALLGSEGKLPVCRAVQIVVEACRGVACVHAAGLIHRDLKPENLFIARRARGEDWCKILDFGVAKMDSSVTTAQGVIVGTVRYMAPEQLSGDVTIGPAVDIYALGAILYECLSGRALFDGGSVQEIMYRIMNREPQPLLELRPDLPPSLSALVMSAVSKQPELRPRTASELESLLLSALSSSSSDSVTISEGQLPRSVRANSGVRVRAVRWPVVVLVASMGVTIGVALVAGGEHGLARSANGSNSRGELPESSPARSVVPAHHPPSPVRSGLLPPVARPAPTTTAASTITSTSTTNAPQIPRARASAPRSAPERSVRPRSESAPVLPQGVSVGTFDDSNPYGE